MHDQATHKLVLKEQGYGSFSARAIAKILRTNDQIVSLDLSMNNLAEGFDDLLQGLRSADNLVSLRLRNNNIDGRKHHEQLFRLFKNHPTLTSIDLGNSENIKNRNRLYNEGLEAVIEGIY
jgi:hypothetical protein